MYSCNGEAARCAIASSVHRVRWGGWWWQSESLTRLSPCNQFGKQEPGTASEIIDFANGLELSNMLKSTFKVLGRSEILTSK